MKLLIKLKVNGAEEALMIEPSWTLAHLLREELNLTGTKIGCGTGDCGSCTVLVNGQPVKSCLYLAVKADGKEVTTIEGLAKNGELHPLQEAFINNFAVQCGYCTPGMILIAKALLDKNPSPSREQVTEWMSGNLCRCTGYTKIVDAVLAASEALKSMK